MCEIPNVEPSNASEALKHQVWKDAMVEEYQSILKNDVWDIVPRPKEKSVISSKWLSKLSMLQMVALKNIKLVLWLDDSLKRKESNLKKLLHQLPGIPQLEL